MIVAKNVIPKVRITDVLEVLIKTLLDYFFRYSFTCIFVKFMYFVIEKLRKK